jgi:hypothetical protein
LLSRTASLPRSWLLPLPIGLALAAILLLLAGLAPARQPALAAGEGGPVVNVDTGLAYGSLGAAINAVETLDGHHLTVAPGNYSGNITITKSLVITGAGEGVTNLDGGGIGRVVFITAGVTVRLTGVSVRNGSLPDDSGAGLYVLGALSLVNSRVYSNAAYHDGGGIYNEGVLTLTYVTVYSNTADTAGGIYNDGLLTMAGGQVAYNTARGAENGGLANYLTATLTNVGVHDNVATSRAGGIGSYGYFISLTNVDIYFNNVVGVAGYAGGMDHETSHGPAFLNKVRIFGNNVLSGYVNFAGGGLAVFYPSGPLTMTNSAVVNNFVGDGGPGGGIHASYDARVWIINSAIYNNQAAYGLGGGIDVGAAGGGAQLTLINSTVSGNNALYGGGLHSADARVYITNTTFNNNSAASGGNLSGTVTLANTILANGSPENCGNVSAILSNGFNLEDDANSCGLAATGDLPGGSALLGPLAGNGATVAENMSYQPRRHSDAVDAGSNAFCAAWLGGQDQRGFSRPIDGDGDTTATCDIGAVEVGLDLFLPLILR